MRYLILLFILMPLPLFGQYLIEGTFDTSSEFKFAQLDILDEWNEFNTVDSRMIVKSVEISPDGRYRIEGNELSDKYGFYRIRFSKLENRVSMNSDYSNFIHFVFSNRDTIYIQDNNYISNNPINELLKNNITTNRMFVSQNLISENQKRRSLILSKHQKYCKRQITSGNNGLVNLYSLVSSQYNIQEQPELYKKVYKELLDSNISPKFATSLNDIIKVYDFNKLRQNNNWLIGLFVSSFLLNLILLFILYKRKTNATDLLTSTSIDSLTNKELEILSLMKLKMTNKEIASKLFVSDSTVKTHINNIYRKLGVKSRKEALMTFSSQKSTPV